MNLLQPPTPPLYALVGSSCATSQQTKMQQNWLVGELIIHKGDIARCMLLGKLWNTGCFADAMDLLLIYLRVFSIDTAVPCLLYIRSCWNS